MMSEPSSRLAESRFDAAAEKSFYISATSASSRPRKSLKHNDTFAVFDSHGDIGVAAGGPDGLFDLDTRFLSYLELLVNDAQPLLLGSHIGNDNLNLVVDLTNPDLYHDDALLLAKDSVHISKTMYLLDGVLRAQILIQNYRSDEVKCDLSIGYDSDFADIFEVRGIRRKRRGKSDKRVIKDCDTVLTYMGLDGQQRETFLCFEPCPTQLLDSVATYALQLKAHESRSIFVSISCRGSIGKSIEPFFTGYRNAVRELQKITRAVASVETSNSTVNEVLSRASADFYTLVTRTAQGLYPYAGIPWYSTTFGRDGIISAMQMLWVDPDIAKGVLRRLAYYQATTDDPANDAQPGKILHEMRGGEMSALHEVPFGLYYGSVDSTPLFVMLAGLYAERTGDLDFIAEIWTNIERALQWMESNAAANRDGFLTYQRLRETGLSNQGWKDSYDAVFHAGGKLAEAPIALAEVQGYFYAALRHAAECGRVLGKRDQADSLARKAERLRIAFEKSFWSTELETYVLALDGSGKPCIVRSSNAGQVLFSGIADKDRAARVAASFANTDMNTGWGYRTISSRELRYNPMSYHNGSVWPHDTALIAAGMGRYGYRSAIAELFDDLCTAATFMEHRRLPELFCGFGRKRNRAPILYPVACSPQAWASGAPFMIIQAMLGLEFDPAGRSIRLNQPVLPPSLDELKVQNLRLRDASIDFVIRKRGTDISVETVACRGDLRVEKV